MALKFKTISNQGIKIRMASLRKINDYLQQYHSDSDHLQLSDHGRLQYCYNLFIPDVLRFDNSEFKRKMI